MEKSVQITLIIVGAVLILGLLGYSLIHQGPTINANGAATVSAEPDVVSVYFNIQTNAETAQDAKDQNNEVFDNVLTALVKTGLERKDITTEYFNINENWEWNGRTREQDGYLASHSIKIKLSTEDVDKVGEIIDAGVDYGADLNYINFELSPEAQNIAKAEAQKQAAQDAQAKAQGIAEGLGKSLGKVISIQTANFNYAPWRVYGANTDEELQTSGNIEEAKVAVTNIQPGEREISGSVIVVYALR